MIEQNYLTNAICSESLGIANHHVIYRYFFMRLAISFLVVSAFLFLGCGSDDNRLIPTSDPQYQLLEGPERLQECEIKTICEENCLHSCTPSSNQPMTCPANPTDRPQRIVGATCDCIDTICQWL